MNNTLFTLYAFLALIIGTITIHADNVTVDKQPGYIESCINFIKNSYEASIENALNNHAAQQARTWKQSLDTFLSKNSLGDISEQERTFLKKIFLTLGNGLEDRKTSLKYFEYIQAGAIVVTPELEEDLKGYDKQKLTQIVPAIAYTFGTPPPVKYHYSPELENQVTQDCERAIQNVMANKTFTKQQKKEALAQIEQYYTIFEQQGFRLPNVTKEWVDNTSRLFKHYAEILDTKAATNSFNINEDMLKDFKTYTHNVQKLVPELKLHDYFAKNNLQIITEVIKSNISKVLSRDFYNNTVVPAYKVFNLDPIDPNITLQELLTKDSAMYEKLNIAADADRSQTLKDIIKRKKKYMMLSAHPDRPGGNTQEATDINEKFNIIQDIFDNNVSIESAKEQSYILSTAVNQLNSILENKEKKYQQERQFLMNGIVFPFLRGKKCLPLSIPEATDIDMAMEAIIKPTLNFKSCKNNQKYLQSSSTKFFQGQLFYVR